MAGFRILVADDHPIFRFGLCSLLRSHKRWEVCGEACDGRDLLEKYRQLKPDLIILDICMPKLNGVDAARQILRENPAQRILVLTNVESEQLVHDCLKAGVRGWVSKSDGIDDLTAAVDALQRRKCIFNSRVSDLIMEGRLQECAGPPTVNVPQLSPREREVLQLVVEGKASKEIATILGVSVKTAETHRSRIMFKLKLHSISELVLYAVRNEIVHVQRPSLLGFRHPGNGRADIAAQALN